MVVKQIDLCDLCTYSQTLEKLISECIETTYEVDCTDAIVKEKMQSMRHHLHNGSAIVLVAMENQAIIGFLWGYELKTLTEIVMHVGYISVLKEFRSRGVASALLEAIQDIASKRNISKIELIVSNLNINATNLYRKNGYMVDRIVMRKQI